MSIWISGGYASWTHKADRLVLSEDDWDVLTVYPVVSAVSLLAALQEYDYGDTHADYEAMVMAARDGEELFCGAGKYKLEVTYKGLADASRPAKYQILGYQERNTYDAVKLPGSSTPVPADVSQPRLGIMVRYVSTERPDTSLIGTNLVPPLDALDVPDNVFSGATDVIAAYPEGWVLEDRGGPNIPGSEVWLVEDKYVFYLDWRPRG